MISFFPSCRKCGVLATKKGKFSQQQQILQITTETELLQPALFSDSCAQRGGRGFHFPTPAVGEGLLGPVTSSRGNALEQRRARPSAGTLGTRR